MQTAASVPQPPIKVMPAGGRFKVHYVRGASHSEEALDKALEDLNGMLVFGPNIKLQQTDIRLVALDRRTYETVAEIRNLHNVTASDVEAFILRFAVGRAGASNTAAVAASVASSKPDLQEFKVIRNKTSASLQLILVMSDGKEDSRHWLNNVAIRSLRQSGAFDPQFDIHMSPTNDTLMAYRKDAPKTKAVETLPLTVAGSSTDAELDLAAQRAQAFLNKYRRQTVKAPVEVKPAASTPAPAPASTAVAPAAAPSPGTPPVKGSGRPAVQAGQPVGETVGEIKGIVRREDRPQALPGKELVSGKERKPVAPAAAPAPASPAPVPRPQPAPALPEPPGKLNITGELFKQAAALTPDVKNAATFDALALCLEANAGIKSLLVDNTYSLLSLSGDEHLGPHFTGFVLTVNLHLAFCRQEMTVRFGLDHTLLENGQSGDTWKFPEHAFLGISCQWEKDVNKIGGFTMLVTGPFSKAIPAGLRAALKHSGIAFEASEGFIEKADSAALIWPSSREDTLFYKTALGIREHYRDAAGADIFPISNDAIKMNPGQPAFVGFRRTARHGIVYQAGDDFFARFDPDESEISAAGYVFAGSAGIIGFALDGSMKMCAIYDPGQAKPGFAPPDNKLIRFISVHEVESVSRQDGGFTCFGLVPRAPVQQPSAESAATRFRRGA